MRQLTAACALLVVAAGLAGCRTASSLREHGKLRLPAWFVYPEGAERAETPAQLGMVPPPHLAPFAKKYGLPGWIVYGVVRCLGAEEFLVNGTFRRFSLTDELGESSVVLDELHYDVSRDRIEARLSSIALACAEADNELERQNALGAYVAERCGAFVLFSLARAGVEERNRLLESGVTDEPLIEFSREEPVDMPALGLRETAGEYVIVHAGDFHYGNVMLAFRRTEEDAIHDLARSLVMKFSHMRRLYSAAHDSGTDDVREEVVKEALRLRMRGVRVRKRLVDMQHGTCVVVLAVPKNGVAIR